MNNLNVKKGEVMDWISVKDKLPGDDHLVLVFAVDLLGGPVIGIECFRRGTKQFSIDGVTHWMTLPPPPQGAAK
jgi:hypothetical protein